MKRACPRLQTGFSLVEVLVALGLLSVATMITMLYVSQVQSGQDTAKKSMKETLLTMRRDIQQHIKNNEAWAFMVNDPENAPMSCLSAGNCADDTPHAFRVLNAANEVVYDPLTPTHGFTLDGANCNEFNPDGASDTCPIRLDLTWQPLCTAGACGQVRINGVWSTRGNPAALMSIDLSSYNFSIIRSVSTTAPVAPSPVTKLKGSDSAHNDHFGHAVAIRDDYAFVGAYGHGPADRGAVYVFKRDTGNNWVESQKINPPGGAPNYFGKSISVGVKDYLVIGAPGYSATEKGAVYIYTLDASGNWQLKQTLTSSDSKNQIKFGQSVSINNFGSAIIVGAPGYYNGALGSPVIGAVEFFRRTADDWSTYNNEGLYANPDGDVNGAGDNFGRTVKMVPDIDGEFAAVGASSDLLNQGSVRLYTYNSAAIPKWSASSKIVAPGGSNPLAFGGSIELDGGKTQVFVGSSAPSFTNAGTVFPYDYDSSTSALTPSPDGPTSGAGGDSFSFHNAADSNPAIARNPARIIIGARGDDDLDSDSGAAHYYKWASGLGLVELTKLKAPDPQSGSGFGETVAISGEKDLYTYVIVAAPKYEDSPGVRTGAVYIFALTGL